MPRTFFTPSVVLPQSDIKFSDCPPGINGSANDMDLSRAYFIGNYNKRSAWTTFDKCPFPPPMNLQVFGSSASENIILYQVTFNEFDNSTCNTNLNCNIVCSTQSVSFIDPSSNTGSTTFCKNGERPQYKFFVEFSSEGDRLGIPVGFNFTFTDSLGNFIVQDIQSIANIRPMTPAVAIDRSDVNAPNAYITLPYSTEMGQALDVSQISQFAIQRSRLGRGDSEYLVSWASIYSEYDNSPRVQHRNLFTDSDIGPDDRYSYRVSFRNNYGETTEWSNWGSEIY